MQVCFLIALAVLGSCGNAQRVAPLPEGVRAVWSLDRAWHETTPTRERICLNGLWRWQPDEGKSNEIPAGNWGWFKVPGCWPGIGDYLQKDCQSVVPHPSWKDTSLGTITAAWYQREFDVPTSWKGRRISIETCYVNSLATVFVDATQAGSISFPEGEVDLTKLVKPGDNGSLP
jgi:beta-galactosidase